MHIIQLDIATRRTRPLLRLLLLLAVGTTLAAFATVAPHAQRQQESPVRLTGVTARKSSDGKTIYTITADKPLNRAQTWQDGSGQHVVLYKGDAALRGALPAGVRVNRVGESLELVLPARAGQRIVVQPGTNQLDFVVSGGNAGAAVNETAASAQAQNSLTSDAPMRVANKTPQRLARPARETSRRAPVAAAAPAANAFSTNPIVAAPTSSDTSIVTPMPGTESTVAAPQIAQAADVNAAVARLARVPPANQPAQAAPAADAENSSLTTYGIVAGTMVCGLMGLVVMRRRRRTDELQEIEEFFGSSEEQPAASGKAKTASGKLASSKTKEKNKGTGKSKTALQLIAQGRSQDANSSAGSDASVAVVRAPRLSLAAPTMIFGAYQIEQEIEKLVLGQAHRLDVVCSRASDDRRAIETSLMKALLNVEATDSARRKARQALEDYGFVARACATLLLAPEVFDRVGAARTLSSIRSAAALPFMIEALYDRDGVVRTEAVAGLGELRLPAAIGALLDVARRHNDISPVLLSSALTACSVESLNFGTHDSTASTADESSDLNLTDGAWTGEIMKLEPVETIIELPQWVEDDTLAEALARLDDSDVEARAAAARQLGQFPVQSSVESLAHLASNDAEVAVRAAAVTSLGALDHESVFAHVLMRLVDEAREVRAAAARALSRLSFDRADAYVRVIETADERTLAAVAAALTGAGMAAQAVDRLISEDRRQAYEAFSLLSLLVKAGEIEALLTGIAEHRDLGVRLALVRFLGLTGGALYIERLMEVGARDGMAQEVRDAITEAESKIVHAEIY